MEYGLGYREVIPDHNFEDAWEEIILSTGGSQSTLQDIKVPERAGGYSYKNSYDTATRNRFIYWKITHDVLELSEHSLDINLANNRVKYKFTDTPILDGITIHETDNLIVILVATVSSVHKLSFPHPVSLQKQVSLVYTDITVSSIFSEASIKNASDPHTFYVVPTAGLTNAPIAHAAASWLVMPQEEALFAFAFNSGTILLLRLDTITGLVHQSELKIESIVPRFLNGIATALRGKTFENEVFMSIVMHAFGNEVYLFTFCKEGHLRMWSCDKAQCVAVINVFTNNQSSNEIIQHHNLRKITNSNDALYLCTYIKLAARCEFSIFKLIQDSAYAFIRVCTLLTPKQHLVDFCFTSSRLWALWRMTDTDNVAITHVSLPLNNTNLTCQWEAVILAEAPDKDYIISDPGTDPRQAYLDFIFHPGQFALVDIIKALNIYRRSNLTLDVRLSPSILKERVCMAVEAEIQAEVVDYELLDDDYLEIVNRCWSRFYSCVLQYHMNRYKPVGFLLLPDVKGAVLLKKCNFSFLRPMEAIEYLMLYNKKSCELLLKELHILQDKDKCQDLIKLMLALVFLEDHLSDEFKSTFDKELYRLKDPDTAIENLLSNTIFNKHETVNFDFQLELHGRLENIEDFQHSITILLKILTYNLDPLNEIGDVKNTPKTHKLYSTVNHFFGSQLGLSVISKIMTQIISMRFAVCRNLLILQRIAMDKQKLFDSRSVNNIKSSLVTRSIVLTQAYYVLMWICESNASVTPSQALLETNIHRIALLTTIKNQTNIGQRHNRTFSLLEMFIQYGTKQYIYKLVDQIIHNSSNFHVWHFGLFNYTNFILQLIWPISENFLFPEWLLANCQFLVIQEYVRLLNGWCALNSASRKFILAISLLEMGESYKASDNFLRASNGVMTDSYMSNLFQMENFSKSKTIVKYYLKVIELFEQHNAQDIIIELAITAITVANKDDSNLPTLHSIVFTQHLNLEHHIEAYNCLNINPDGARRIDCLRQLIVVLFNRKKLKDLISFPYIDMYQDLEKIMETRARSIDLMENNYYNFLYSFHINKGNMRKAASVMYEQAMRLSQEPYSWSTISQQVHCLLACINVLRLVHKKFRWIVRPVIDHSSIDDYPNKRKKRNSNGHEILQCNYSKRIEVLELEDIKREYALASSKLKLTKIGLKANNISSAGPSEIAAILSNYGLHVDAVDICRYFKLSIISILENLVSHCTRLDPKDQFKTYSWLDEIPVVGYNLLTSSSMNISWKLLQYFILQYEEIGNSELHKAVTKQLLYHEIFLPEWLYSSYAKKNAPEFLRLLIQMGRLDEAAYFSIKYIQAILGKGKAYFGLESSLSVTTFSTFFPFNYIEILLLELEYASRTENSYIMVREQLKNEYDIYLKSVKHISMNMVLMKKNA
ncbi:nuclear pore complex protein Nup160 homolog isoform X2 [Phymastichus coffea]|uniref:nuclear pore complex protein Nup160 homolog isoform X2 n=1 Tax=Phymastichus coffea TaxID=108790 RepID=UPI00273B5DF2|nr:nuclear pore complex protein Nup160 homolog isoform X2 [Phymastichus coffea]